MYASIRKVANLEAKFANLANVAKKAQKFDLSNIDRAPGSGTSADLIAHQQGMCRCDGAGDFIISGSVRNSSSTSNDRPYFYVIKNGQGSKAVSGQDYYQIKNEENPLLTEYINNNDRTKMTHPGGVQVCENILAVGHEDYNGLSTRTDRSFVRFFDIGDETNIQEIKSWGFGRWGANLNASAMGLVRRNGQWILAIRANGYLEVYLNNESAVGAGSFNRIASIPYNSGNQINEFQGINLFLSDENRVYLFGEPKGGSNDDIMWLHELQFTYDTADAETNRITGMQSAPARYVNQVHFYRDGSGPRFKYAACIFVNEYNQFEVYSAEMHVIDRKIRCNGWNQGAQG